VSAIVARICRALGLPTLADALVDRLAPSELQSLLLHVFQRRARAATAAGLLAQAERSLLVSPCAADARAQLEIDRVAFAAAPAFEAVELSPVAPLASNFVLGNIDQNLALATIRNVEVLADPTTAQAIECARRRRRSPSTVQLCASQRMVRLQPFDRPGFAPHFRLFSLVTAGRDLGSERFETDALREHLAVYLRLLDGLAPLGYRFGDVEVAISDTELWRETPAWPTSVVDPRSELDGAPERARTRLAHVKERVVDPLARPDVRFRFDLTRNGRAYYPTLCFRIDATDREGERYPLGDGGLTNWTQALLDNKKERLLVSGIGTELICKRYHLTRP
jgi:hypothetical protein